jgi:hypothetical protein
MTRVRECDMRWLAAGFVFVISAETAISWRIRSVAGHGWFGSEQPARKTQNPNPKTQIPMQFREHSAWGFELVGIWDLGFGIWVFLATENDAKVAPA